MAINVTGDPALGLHLPGYYNSGQSHFVPSIIFSSATLLDGLRQWVRYASLVCDADRFELQERGDFVTLVYTNISPAHKTRWLAELYFSQIASHFPQAIHTCSVHHWHGPRMEQARTCRRGKSWRCSRQKNN